MLSTLWEKVTGIFQLRGVGCHDACKVYVMLECVSPQTRDVDLSQAGRGLEEALLGLGSAGNTQREDG